MSNIWNKNNSKHLSMGYLFLFHIQCFPGMNLYLLRLNILIKNINLYIKLYVCEYLLNKHKTHKFIYLHIYHTQYLLFIFLLLIFYFIFISIICELDFFSYDFSLLLAYINFFSVWLWLKKYFYLVVSWHLANKHLAAVHVFHWFV